LNLGIAISRPKVRYEADGMSQRRARLHRKLAAGTTVRVPTGGDETRTRRDVEAFAKLVGRRALIVPIGGDRLYVRFRDR
jgi:hypothetical protein